MKFKNMNVEAGSYRIEFEDVVEDRLVKVAVEFYEIWSLTKKKDITQDFGGVVGFYMPSMNPSPFPYDFKKNLKSLPLHIPHPLGRELFKVCFEKFVDYTDAPAHIALVEHPGYPLVVVDYDVAVINQEETIYRWINNIMNGIQNCEFTTEEVEVASFEEDDLDDEVDENVIIEMDFDPELKALMKTSDKEEFLEVTDEEIDEFVKEARETVND